MSSTSTIQMLIATKGGLAVMGVALETTTALATVRQSLTSGQTCLYLLCSTSCQSSFISCCTTAASRPFLDCTCAGNRRSTDVRDHSFPVVAADCLPGLVCDYTARQNFAVCVEPVSLGGTCGARRNGSNAIGKTGRV